MANEAVLDHTYLRPGIVSRAGAISLAALGIGVGALLACYGASFFFNTDQKKLDTLTAIIDELVKRPDRSDEVIARLDDLRRDANKISGDVTTHLASIEESLEYIKHMPILDSNIATHLASIEKDLEELKHRQIISGNPEQHERTASPKNVIEREVTVFHAVPHDSGNIDTGWKYPDGASADQRPTSQFCYWLSNGSPATYIVIAINGVRLPNIGVGVPDLEEALQKCVWWNGSTN